MPHAPLSTPLSHALIAYTIELDNEFERRFAETGIGRRFGISLVMWSNFLRFVGDGVTVGELPVVSGLPKATVRSTLGGMERWRYVYVVEDPAASPPESKRDGWGSGRGLRQEWVVRPTPAGVKARRSGSALFGDIETRWEERFGRNAIRDLRRSSEEVVAQLAVELPEYLPIIGANGMAAEIAHRERQTTGRAARDHRLHVPTLLAQVLLAYTLDFERASDVSLPLSANFLRVLDETGVDVRELPALAGVSKEGASMALRFLTKNGHVRAEAKRAYLTPKGGKREAARVLHTDLERAWEVQFGASTVRLRSALDRSSISATESERGSLGLQPPPGGWRATKPYAARTQAMIDDPIGTLPRYPMCSRGGPTAADF